MSFGKSWNDPSVAVARPSAGIDLMDPSTNSDVPQPSRLAQPHLQASRRLAVTLRRPTDVACWLCGDLRHDALGTLALSSFVQTSSQIFVTSSLVLQGTRTHAFLYVIQCDFVTLTLLHDQQHYTSSPLAPSYSYSAGLRSGSLFCVV